MRLRLSGVSPGKQPPLRRAIFVKEPMMYRDRPWALGACDNSAGPEPLKFRLAVRALLIAGQRSTVAGPLRRRRGVSLGKHLEAARAAFFGLKPANLGSRSASLRSNQARRSVGRPSGGRATPWHAFPQLAAQDGLLKRQPGVSPGKHLAAPQPRLKGNRLTSQDGATRYGCPFNWHDVALLRGSKTGLRGAAISFPRGNACLAVGRLRHVLRYDSCLDDLAAQPPSLKLAICCVSETAARS